MSKIADNWQTSRLSVNTNLLDESPDLLDVFNSCTYVEPWPALRFCVRNGFTRIVEMRADSIQEQNRHADLVLEKII
jgi:hypothetical protein